MAQDPSRATSRRFKSLSSEALFQGEKFWRQFQPLLEQHGYLLRPRYNPNNNNFKYGNTQFFFNSGNVIDGFSTRLNRLVAIKHVCQKPEAVLAVEIARYLSTDAISGDPKNHCVPIYDIIPIPGMPGDYLIVMPLLRAFDKPDFENIGQFLEFMHQILEGVVFMHRRGISHGWMRPCYMLMDAKPLFSSKGYSLLCPELTASHGEYAKGVLRSDLGRDTSLKYYIVNFSQFRRHASIDDFNRDIFTVGRGLLHMVQYEYMGLAFLVPLIEAMVWGNPSRPSAQSALDTFNASHANKSDDVLSGRVQPSAFLDAPGILREQFVSFFRPEKTELRWGQYSEHNTL